MSFRYTNNLIGVLKHRLCLEAAHRDIARRTFTGTCDGIEVTCSGFGSVLAMRLLDPARWEPFYRTTTTTTTSISPSTTNPSSSSDGGLDLVRLARSVRAATWEALQRISAAKEEAHARSLRANSQLLARGTLREWYEEDATTLRPHTWSGLKEELATPWMQAVRYGKPRPARYRMTTTGEETQKKEDGEAKGDSFSRGGVASQGCRVRVLEEEDCQPSGIPVASTHPLYTAALIHLEGDANDDGRAGSRINAQAVLREQRREMSQDELLFWERVEFIRCGQLGSIPGGVKRGYADQASTVVDSVEDKIELRFTE
ncbi:unnamed protein product [Phytomonas sp. EM1]|nr:unnamed protein product [Phytomonas sp. EM1]|eukprot:CCW63987.1 unnamed protein product [Phytomonas sp. isolate EM1]